MKEYKFLKLNKSVGAMGLGCMPLSISGRPVSSEQRIALIHRALDLGVTFFDTADSYCLDENDKHHNESLIHKALKSYTAGTDRVMVATKGGLMRHGGAWTVNGDPNHIGKTIRDSWQALGGDRPIDLWQLHAVDPKFPLVETLAPVVAAQKEGLIAHVGVSNFSVSQIEEARSLLDIVSVQNQLNPWHLNPLRDGVFDYCEREQLAFLPWSPLGGSSRVQKVGQNKYLRSLSEKLDRPPHEVLLAWHRQRGKAVLPIPGAKRLESLESSVRSLDIELKREEVSQIESSFS